MAEDIVVFSGAIPVEEINKCLTHPGYVSVLFAKLPELAKQEKAAPSNDADAGEIAAPGFT